jgi:hypothetical protein
MKKIANIISSKELVNHTKLNWINYLTSINGCDTSLPTLFIGWKEYKEIFKNENPNILNKKSKNKNLRWEFSIDEMLTDYFNGIEKFIKEAPREFCENFEYISIDPIKDNINNESDILSKINLNNCFIYQYKDEIIYILNKNENKIYGIFLNSFSYFKYNISLISDMLSSYVKNKIIDDGTIYQQYYKQFPDFDYLKRSIVLFFN